MTTKDPNTAIALYAFFGVVVTGIGAILTELIRNTRKTESVQDDIKDLTSEVHQLKTRVDGHIQWHFERGNNDRQHRRY